MVESVFDKFWDDNGRGYGKVAGDQNAYTVGMIGDHNVVLAHMPGMGSSRPAIEFPGDRNSFCRRNMRCSTNAHVDKARDRSRQLHNQHSKGAV